MLKISSLLKKQGLFNLSRAVFKKTPAPRKTYQWLVEAEDICESLHIDDEAFVQISTHPVCEFEIKSAFHEQLMIHRSPLEKYLKEAGHPHIDVETLSKVLGITGLKTIQLDSSFLTIPMPAGTTLNFKIPMKARARFNEFVRECCEMPPASKIYKP